MPSSLSELTAAFPPPCLTRREEIARLVQRSEVVVFALDDDPTGSQSVHGVPVLTDWEDESLAWALEQRVPLVFLLTNTRSLGPVEVKALLRDLVPRVVRQAQAHGMKAAFLCRGDSTLRGHFPLEPQLVAEALASLGEPVDGTLFVPAYPEAGRVTVGGTHYAKVTDGKYVPVAETDYAQDATFGYSHSNLGDYVREKYGPVDVTVTEIDLNLIRSSTTSVRDALLSMASGGVAVADTASLSDLDNLVLGLLEAEATGHRYVYRAGPSFAAARVGMEPSDPVRPLAPEEGKHGLVVVGSHVALTGRQLEALREVPGTRFVELDVPRVLEGDAEGAVQEAAAAVSTALDDADAVLYTTRARSDGADGEASLNIARAVSSALTEVVFRLRHHPRLAWVIAKGGITSHDVATKGLGIRRAMIAGQLFPGMTSLWVTAGGGDVQKGLSYVVFPGNVGDDEALADAVRILRGNADSPSPLPTEF